MSYCRFGEGDVYVFLHSSGHLYCCGCMLQVHVLVDDPSSFFGVYLTPVGEKIETSFTTTAGMIEHLRRHVAASHYVPAGAFTELEHDRVTNDAWLAAKKERAGT